MDDLPIRRFGYLVLLLTFGCFGGWAAFAPLNGAVIAPAVVTVKSYRKTVQHLEGGIVRELRVHDGDSVRAGDVLLVLDDTQARAEQEMTRSQLVAAVALEARLRAERDGLDAPAAVGGADLEVGRLEEARDSEARIFQARRASLLGEVGILERSVVQLEAQVHGLTSAVESKQQLAASYIDEIGDLRALLSEGFVDKQRLRDQERSLARLQSELAEQRSAIAQAKLRISEIQLQTLQRRKAFASEVASQLGEVQGRIFDLREKLTAMQDRSRRTLVTAPESGMVMGLTVHTVGGVVKPATPLLDIVPADADLIIEARVAPTDIDRVALGMQADIRFSAFSSGSTPRIEGKLTQLSADRLSDPESGAYYLARLELTAAGRRSLNELKLVAGMPAEVLINTGERTLLDYLIQPASNALARAMVED